MVAYIPNYKLIDTVYTKDPDREAVLATIALLQLGIVSVLYPYEKNGTLLISDSRNAILFLKEENDE